MFENQLEVGIITFGGHDAAEHLVGSLSAAGASEVVDEVGIIEHHPNGRFSVHSYRPGATRGEHAATGALVGGMFGLLLGPFGLIAGIFGGAAVGASMLARDPHQLEVSDAFVQRVRDALPAGSSAVVIIGEPDAVSQFVGKIRSSEAVTVSEIREPLSDAQVQAIREALAR